VACKRVLAAGATVLLLAGCGGHAQLPTLRFKSRPDLKPPPVTVLKDADDSAPGYIFLSPKKGAPQKGPEIVEPDGQPVWFDPVAPADQATDFRVQTYRGKPVLTWWEGPVASPIVGTGFGHYVVMNSSYDVVARVQGGLGRDSGDLHEFQLTPRGTALVTEYKVIRGSLAAIGGPKNARIADSILQEIDVATGKAVFTWHSIGHVPIGESYIPLHGPGAPAPGYPYDYFHVNSVEEEPNGNFLVSARNTCALYEIDRKTGDVLWRLGGKKSDFAMGPGTTFWWQHDARRQPDGTITVFDDGAAPPREPRSRALRLRVDLRHKTVALAQADVAPAGVLTGSQGNVQALDGGNLFVGWGAIPRVTEFDPSGRIVYDATFPDGEDSYRAYRFGWSGTPTTKPAIATAKGRGGTKTIYASWNGATNVRSWQVLAGDSQTRLARVGDPQPANGFETTLRADTDAPWIAVEALDANGEALGTSAAVAISGGLATG
jgi:arylsulfotransferase ASST